MIPPQQRIDESWYQGTADAIYQNVYTIPKAAPRDTLILGGDHIYKMNYANLIDFHRENQADLTVACLPVPRAEAREFGVVGVDEHAARSPRSSRSPRRSPRRCPATRSSPWRRWGFTSSIPTSCTELLFQDAARKESSNHDFGTDIIPRMV